MMLITKRYIDDIGTLLSPLFSRHVYNDRAADRVTRLTGIYPSFLKITSSHSDRNAAGGAVPFLDTSIRPGANGSLQTFLHDKREHPPLSTMKMKFIKYPHISSLLDSTCKYNVLTGQVHRYVARISDYDDFTQRCASLIMYLTSKNGYNSNRLFHILRRTLEHLCDKLFPGRPGSSPHTIYIDIQRRFHREAPAHVAASTMTQPRSLMLARAAMRRHYEALDRAGEQRPGRRRQQLDADTPARPARR